MKLMYLTFFLTLKLILYVRPSAACGYNPLDVLFSDWTFSNALKFKDLSVYLFNGVLFVKGQE